mgnify:FL=1
MNEGVQVLLPVHITPMNRPGTKQWLGFNEEQITTCSQPAVESSKLLKRQDLTSMLACET